MPQTVSVNLSLIDSRKQARKSFDEARLRELADSIKENGVLQPILLRAKKGNRYEIIAGERRVRASRMAGLQMIPAIVKESDDLKTMIDSFLENVQREDLTSAEKEDGLISLWKSGRFKIPKDLDKALGYGVGYSSNVIEAREFRDKYNVPGIVATTTITSSRGLPDETRRRLLDRVSKDEGKFGQVRTVREMKSIIEKAPAGITDSLLEGKLSTDDATKAVELYQEANNVDIKPLAKAIEKGELNIALAEKSLKLYSDLQKKGVSLNQVAIERDLQQVKMQDTFDQARERVITQNRVAVLSGTESVQSLDQLTSHWAEGLEQDPAPIQEANRLKWNIERIENMARKLNLPPSFYTTSYSGRDVETFVQLMKAAKVGTVYDIRDTPRSQFRPDFNKDAIVKALKAVGIDYKHVPELGVKREVRDELAKSGDYGVFWKKYDDSLRTKEKAQLIEQIGESFDDVKGEPFALLCTERDPHKCHRHRLALHLAEKWSVESIDI